LPDSALDIRVAAAEHKLEKDHNDSNGSIIHEKKIRISRNPFQLKLDISIDERDVNDCIPIQSTNLIKVQVTLSMKRRHKFLTQFNQKIGGGVQHKSFRPSVFTVQQKRHFYSSLNIIL